MITIVRSYWTPDPEPQADGRVRITEVHVDSEGREHVNNGLYEPDYDPNTELTLRGQVIADSLNAPPEDMIHG